MAQNSSQSTTAQIPIKMKRPDLCYKSDIRPEQQQLQAWFPRQQYNLQICDCTASHVFCICCFNFWFAGIYTAAYSLCCTPYCSSSNTEDTPPMAAQNSWVKASNPAHVLSAKTRLSSLHTWERMQELIMSILCFALLFIYFRVRVKLFIQWSKLTLIQWLIINPH